MLLGHLGGFGLIVVAIATAEEKVDSSESVTSIPGGASYTSTTLIREEPTIKL